MSSLFDALSGAGDSFELARMALVSSPPGKNVNVFEENPIGIAAVCSPIVMKHVASHVPARLNILPDDERQILIDTLRLDRRRRINSQSCRATRLPPKHRPVPVAENRAAHRPATQ